MKTTTCVRTLITIISMINFHLQHNLFSKLRIVKDWIKVHRLVAIMIIALLMIIVLFLVYKWNRSRLEKQIYESSYLRGVETAGTLNQFQSADDRAFFLASLASMAYSEQDYPKALQYYTQAINLKPNEAWLHMSIADVYEKVGDSSNASNYYQLALDYYQEKVSVLQSTERATQDLAEGPDLDLEETVIFIQSKLEELRD